MINLSKAVEEVLISDDVAMTAAQRGWLNLSSYARSIQPRIHNTLMKEVQIGSIITALSRVIANLPTVDGSFTDVIESLAVHSNLEGMTYERSKETSTILRDIYSQTSVDDKRFLTVTQGMNEITVVANSEVAQTFREKLRGQQVVYDKINLVGITVKFKVSYLEIPNLIYSLCQRLAYKNINIVEIVSTATELTYIIEKKDLSVALGQLQKDI